MYLLLSVLDIKNSLNIAVFISWDTLAEDLNQVLTYRESFVFQLIPIFRLINALYLRLRSYKIDNIINEI